MGRGSRGKTPVSLAAAAGTGLAAMLPNARVLYVSATGATDPLNLGYTDRLGLWGEGTAFGDKKDFILSIESSGIAGMELVARDMKQMGMYIARGLSFDGVQYERLNHTLSDDQRAIYDRLAEAWQYTLANIQLALEVTGAALDGRAKGAALSAFWGCHQRFFNQIICAMQMPSVIADIEKILAEGVDDATGVRREACAVLQLVNTNEAAQERAIAKLDEDDDLGDIDMTPRDQLIQLVEHCFPTTQYEEYEDGDSVKSRPVLDSKGNIVKNAEAEALKAKLLNDLRDIRVPEGPLEMLLNHFGVDNVAEVTGRSRRVVRQMVDGVQKTVQETRSQMKALQDARLFMDDRKRVLVFSDAGGTGASYHASRQVKNQRLRVHYLIQPGWIADQAVQGFGRTHRSDQVFPPLFKLVQTDIKGQRRFISTIARRLDQLGALTKGQRQTATQGMFESTDNLESSHAKDALYCFYRDLYANKVRGLTIKEFCRQTGLQLVDKEGNLKKDLPPITQFLNRLLSLTLEAQDFTFECYDQRLRQCIQAAYDAGMLDVGVETIRAEKIEKVGERLVYTHAATGAITKHVELRLRHRNQPRTFDEMVEGKHATYFRKVEMFAVNSQSKKLYAITAATERTDTLTGKITNMVRQMGPLTEYVVPAAEVFENKHWHKVDVDEARRLWDAQVAASPEFSDESLHLIVGILLPIWDRLPLDYPKVKRLRTDAGEVLLGRLVPDDALHDTLTKLGVNVEQTYTPDELAKRLLAGTHKYELTASWSLKPCRVAGERRIELVGPQFMHRELVDKAGVWAERLGGTQRYFVPADPEQAQAVIGKIIAMKPVLRSAKVA